MIYQATTMTTLKQLQTTTKWLVRLLKKFAGKNGKNESKKTDVHDHLVVRLVLHQRWNCVGSRSMPMKLDRIAHRNAKDVAKHMEKYLTPCMPTIRPEQTKQHRGKLIDRTLPFNLMVARPVGRQEMTDSPEAQAAMQKEWAALDEQKV